ncbi:hypothetical protein BDW74DRAFT_189570 [Aspergillus multicolor]|uniref:uncharacterized protein n=1 Tax=Aspergillus multicolor TaxID=41759 RepID=UPI003CCCFB05
MGDDPAIRTSTTSLANGSLIADGDDVLSRRVTRKIDIRVVPMLCALYLTAYLDRTNIGNARLLGLEDELGMPSNGYNTAVWVFYLTFVLMEVPSNLLMTHSAIPPNYWLGVSMTLLGIVTMRQGFTQAPGALYACRAIMGIFEGSLGPAAALMMGAYYRKHEFAIRYTCFTTSALVGASFSSFLAYAINFMDGVQGISSWRWIFILEGLFNISVALCTFFVLLRFPAESTFLTADEKRNLLDRLHAERGDEAAEADQPWRSIFLNWQTWVNIIAYFSVDMSATAISQFSPTILKQLGSNWTANESNVRSVPVWLIGALIALCTSLLFGKPQLRFPFIIAVSMLCLVGWSIQLAQVSSPGVRYFALYFIAAGAFVQLPLLVSWLSANTVGRRRKAVAHALQIGLGNSANFASANVFIKGESPRYTTGFTAGLVITVIGMMAACLLEVILWRANRAADEREERGEIESKMVGKDGMRFRFTL